MRRTLIRAGIIVVVGVAMGVTVNAVRPDVDKDGRPRSLSWITPPKPALEDKDQISLADAEVALNSGVVVFLDARAPTDYAAGHIALAHNLPVEEFEKYYPDVAGFLSPETEIIVYCDGVECDLSHRLVEQLRKLDYRNVRVLVNGWTVWRDAKLPTSKGNTP